MLRFLLSMLVAASAFASTPTTVGITSSANPSEFGHAISLTATVSPAAATGKVTFYLGTTILEIETLASGTATLTTSLLPSGSASLKAYYGGDSNYAASTSALLPQTVNTVPANGFLPPGSYTIGLEPTPVTIGDFNGDGKADIAVAYSDSNYNGYVGILLGNGDGTFGAATTYATGQYPLSIAIGDFNGDGKPDIAVGSSSIGVLLGNGDGTFQPATQWGSWPEESASSISVADVNGDGRADLVVGVAGLETGTDVSVLLGNGDGTFKPPLNQQGTSGDPTSLVVGDFNGDGKPDIALAFDNSASPAVLLGNGDGTFGPEVFYSSNTEGVTLAAADINGDGILDLVLGERGTFTDTFLGNGDGTFRPSQTLEYGGAGFGVAVGDVNGDGKPDIVLGDDADSFVGGAFVIYLGNGDGTFQSPVGYDLGYYLQSVILGDFNGDGRVDLAFTSAIENNSDAHIYVFLGSVPTSTVLESSPNPSVYGQNVTLTATVSPSAAGGTVTFLDGSTALGTATINGGIATFDTSTLAAGAHSLTASYGGAVGYSPSTSAPVSQTVNQGPTVTSLTSSQNPSVWGKGIVLTAVVSPGASTGTIAFLSGSTTLGASTLSGGEATLTVATLPVGEDSLTAAYSGDANHLASTSPVLTQTVGHASTSTTLTSSPNPSANGQTVTLTATVSPAAATGTLTFLDGITKLASGTFNGGTATLNVSTLAPGTHSLTASYSGNSKFAPSTSSVVTQTVTKTPTTTTLTSSPNPSNSGQAVMLTATVTPSTAGGAVTFNAGSTKLGTGTLKQGKATLSISTLPTGSRTLTAVYAGDNDDAGSTSPKLIQVVE